MTLRFYKDRMAAEIYISHSSKISL